ncbi:MAG: hypothetical protein OXF02_05390 [Simkaniaceae bacterium]|nr:hypothetical protein [Simkaniaceae bacterium]
MASCISGMCRCFASGTVEGESIRSELSSLENTFVALKEGRGREVLTHIVNERLLLGSDGIRKETPLDIKLDHVARGVDKVCKQIEFAISAKRNKLVFEDLMATASDLRGRVREYENEVALHRDRSGRAWDSESR